ncbi:MAG TPA: TolC family protein [Planctomycetota bacterium]|nr:TolC family protein [Planctomycetota bacterium]
MGNSAAAGEAPPPTPPTPAPKPSTPAPAAGSAGALAAADERDQEFIWIDPVAELGPPVELTLDSAVEAALHANLDLIEAQLSDSSAATSIVRADAAFDPNLALTYTHNADADNHPTSSDSSSLALTQPNRWGGSVRASANYTNNVNGAATSDSQTAATHLSLTQPIWRNAGSQSAEADLVTSIWNREISANDLLTQVQQLAFNVRTAFTNIQTFEQEVEVNRGAVQRAKDFLTASRTRKKAGAISLLDVRNAEVQVANSELALINSQRNLAGQLDSLKQLLNIPLGRGVKLKGDLPQISGARPAGDNNAATGPTDRLAVDAASHRVVLELLAPGKADPAHPLAPGEEVPPVVVDTKLLFKARDLDYETELRNALQRRLSLQSSAKRFEISYLTYRVTVDNDTPSLSLTGSYDRSDSDTEFGRAMRMNKDGWSLGVNYAFTLGRRADRAAVEAARLALERTYWTWVEDRRGVELDVRNVLRDLRQAELSIYNQATAVEQTRFAFQGTLVELNNGTLDSFAFIQAESRLLDAETGLVRAIQSYKNLEFRLGLVTGQPVALPELIDQYRQVVPQGMAQMLREAMQADQAAQPAVVAPPPAPTTPPVP